MKTPKSKTIAAETKVLSNGVPDVNPEAHLQHCRPRHQSNQPRHLRQKGSLGLSRDGMVHTNVEIDGHDLDY